MSSVMSGYQEAAKLVTDNVMYAADIIDFRSDTITKPTQEMREKMMNAIVGDDVYKEDPTVNELEHVTSKMLGKEAALFVPSGTMSNLIALLTHCTMRGAEAIVGDESHILHYEQTGAAQFGGINLRAVKTYANGTLDLDEVEHKIRNSSDCHQSVSTLLCLENTHNRCGGRIVPMDFILKASALAKKHKLKFHLDGARIFNAAIALGIPVAEIAKEFDSVSICLSKGLGAPVGSLLVGSKVFIQQALRCRKALGGGMRQAGILAAAGLLALQKGPERMMLDHTFTKEIALTAQESGQEIVDVDLDTVETNMVMLKVKSGHRHITPYSLVSRLAKSTEEEIKVVGRDIRVLAYPMTAVNVRIVVHCNLSAEEINLAQLKIAYVLKELRQSCINGH